ncbi:MAG: hypothetical protein WAO52_04885 [Prolixibacteraceae bacterium]
MRKENNIDDLFREKLQHFELDPPAFLLENVLAKVAEARRKKKIVLWRMIGAAAAILLVFITGWELTDMQFTYETKQPIVSGVKPVPETNSEKLLQNRKSEQNNLLLTAASTPSESLPVKKVATASGKISGDKLNTLVSEPENRISKNEPGFLTATSQSTQFNTIEKISSEIAQESTLVENLQEKVTVEIREKATGENPEDRTEKTIDQQIMEQNQEMLTAQNTGKPKGRWLLGAQVSPDVSVSRSSHSEQYASNMIKSGSSKPVGLGGGISLEYKSGRRWSIQSGVYYSGLSQNSGNSSNRTGGKDYALASPGQGADFLNPVVNVDAGSNNLQLNSAAGVIELKSIPSQLVLGTNIEDKSMASTVIVSSAEFIQNFEYIEIPLYLRYKVIDSRFDVEMLGGFSSNLLVGNQTYLEDNSGKSLVGKTNDMQFLNYSGTLGLGLRYSLSKHISLNLEPRIKYFLNSLNNNSSVTYKPYTIGVYTGLSYEF